MSNYTEKDMAVQKSKFKPSVQRLHATEPKLTPDVLDVDVVDPLRQVGDPDIDEAAVAEAVVEGQPGLGLLGRVRVGLLQDQLNAAGDDEGDGHQGAARDDLLQGRRQKVALGWRKKKELVRFPKTFTEQARKLSHAQKRLLS